MESPDAIIYTNQADKVNTNTRTTPCISHAKHRKGSPTLEAMLNQNIKMLLLNLSMGQHSWNTCGWGFIKAFDHIIIALNNRAGERRM